MRTIYVPLYVEGEPFKSHKIAQARTTFRENIKDVYWIAGSKSKTEKFDDATRILTLPIEEKFENIYLKTLLAFRWLLKNEDFDFLIRTNTSTYFDVKKVNEEIHKLQDITSVAAGEFGESQLMSNAPMNTGIFLAGTAIILSRHVVERIVRLDDSEWKDFPDDVALSMGISKLGITFSHLSRIDLTDYKIFEPGSHYRIKSWENYSVTESRFSELELLLHSRPVMRILSINQFHIREFSRYTKAFPINRGLNSIRQARQLFRYLKLNIMTWKWIFGLYV